MSAPRDTAARVRRLIRDRLAIEVPDERADLIDGGVLDSLNIVELLLHIEREFGVRVSVEEVELADFRTVDSIVRCVERLSGAAPRR